MVHQDVQIHSIRDKRKQQQIRLKQQNLKAKHRSPEMDMVEPNRDYDFLDAQREIQATSVISNFTLQSNLRCS